MTNKSKQKWIHSAKGLIVIIYVLVSTSGAETVFLKFLKASMAPFLLFLNGYEIAAQRSWKEYFNKLLEETHYYLTPFIIGSFLDMLIRFRYEEETQNVSVFIVQLREWLLSMLWCFRDTLNGTQGVNIFWLFPLMFFARGIASFLLTFFINHYGSKGKYYACGAMGLFGCGGILLGKMYIFLWFGIDIALAGLLFVAAGQLFHSEKKKTRSQQVDEDRVLIVLGVLAIVVFLLSIRGNSFPDLAVRNYNGFLFGIPFMLSAVFIMSVLVSLVNKVQVASDWTALVGRHFILYLFVSRYRHLVRIEYISGSPVFEAIGALFLTTAVAQLLLCSANHIISVKDYDKDIDLFTSHQQLFEIAYYFAFAIIFAYNFFTTTMFYWLDPNLLQLYVLNQFSICLCVFIFSATAVLIREKFIFWLEVIIFFVSQVVGFTHVNFLLVALPVCILAMTGKSMKVVGYIAAVETVIWLIASHYASVEGYIQYLIFYGDRHAFGSVHNLELCAHLLYLLLLICSLYYMKKDQLNSSRWMAAVLVTISSTLAFAVRYVHGRVDIVLIAGLLIITFIYAVFELSNYKGGKIASSFSACLIPVYIVVGTIAFLSAYLFNTQGMQRIIVFIEETIEKGNTLTARFRMGWMAIQAYGYKPFGSMIYENGAGGRRIGELAENYFFLDSAYMRLIIIYGYILTALFLIVMTLWMLKLWQLKRYYMLLLAAIVAASGVTEQHMLEVSYNVLALMVFSREMGMVHLEEKKDMQGRASSAYDC